MLRLHHLVELRAYGQVWQSRHPLGLTAYFARACDRAARPNGAGKSTLINTLLGFYKSFGWFGAGVWHDVGTNLRKIRGLVGYMPENDAFISKMSAVSFVQMMGELSGLPSRWRWSERTKHCSTWDWQRRATGIRNVFPGHEATGEVGAGHRPRAQTADSRRADERAGSFGAAAHDPHDQRNSRRQEMRIVLCSHLLRDVEDTCDEVLILKQGLIAHYSNLDEERRANKRFLELETYGANGDFTEAIEKLGCECAVTANRMKMILADGIETRDIFRLAAEKQVRIRRMNFRRDTLEDIFLKAMES